MRRALRESESGGACGEMPADGAHGAAGAGKGCGLGCRFLGQLQANVALFHDARRGEQADAAGDKNRLGVAVAEGLELAQPAGQHGSDAVQRQLGMNAQKMLRLAGGQMLFGVEAQAALQLGQAVGGQGKADGEGVAAEAGEEIGAALEGVEKLEAVDGAAGAVGHAVFNADDDGGLGGALDDARGENADDAAVPALAVDHQQAVGGQFRVRRRAGPRWRSARRLRSSRRSRLSRSSLAASSAARAAIAGGKELDDLGGHIHASGGVDARRQAEGDVEAGELPWRQGRGPRRQRARADRRRRDGAVRSDPSAAMTRFSPAAEQRQRWWRWRPSSESWAEFFRGCGPGRAAPAAACASFMRDRRAAEEFFRIAAARLIGIQNGQRVGNGIARPPADDGR